MYTAPVTCFFYNYYYPFPWATWQDPAQGTVVAGGDDDEFMMELAAARAAMEEQSARRGHTGEEDGGQEEGTPSGAGSGLYNKVCA